MAHKEQQAFCLEVKERFPAAFKDVDVLDVGSLDVNGSNRVYFEDASYLGIDLLKGKGVDRVCKAWEVEGDFDTIICTEVLEHDKTWRETVAAMCNKLRPGGLLVITCAGPGRPEHGTFKTGGNKGIPWARTDYYRNISPIELLAAMTCKFSQHETRSNEASHDTYFYGIR